MAVAEQIRKTNHELFEEDRNKLAIGYRLILVFMLTVLTWQVQAKEYTFKENQTSCDEGQSAGCFNLGIAYGQGKGVAKDLTKAAQLYEKACSMENVNACFNLGNAYDQGKGVAKDHTKAAQLYEKACSMEDDGACVNLGAAYYQGLGVAKNTAKAIQFSDKACRLGNSGGCKNAKIMRNSK